MSSGEKIGYTKAEELGSGEGNQQILVADVGGK
ncbi:hypothetical protein MHSWG343_04940 [Candidatus Mycoplasma haematohominis]|uniref:Uncharacterized protein n=1 Tax=Candidatus Mycoplasma haematohominis TaxID=1494318 RepID=A0A478FQU6_9MOLU|nr:hypothetical protein MHSWG343_04940 [Candidatus Mycoplasma haemohominis]